MSARNLRKLSNPRWTCKIWNTFAHWKPPIWDQTTSTLSTRQRVTSFWPTWALRCLRIFSTYLYSWRVIKALPFNAILFQMQDGYFTTHEVCSLLRATGTLKTVEYPPIPTTNPVCSLIQRLNCRLTSISRWPRCSNSTYSNPARSRTMIGCRWWRIWWRT